MSMIERLIYTALQDGITELKNDPQRLELFFSRRAELSDAEIASIKTKFLAKPPEIIHNYPRSDSPFPVFAIVLGNEDESQKFLDDFGGVVGSDELEGLSGDFLGSEERSSIYRHTYNVLIYTENADVTMWYYELVKYFMVRKRKFFKSKGVLTSRFGGTDLKPDGGLVPEFLFVRQFSMSCQSELTIYDDKAPIIRSVDGIHVDESGSPSDVGGVRTLVTVIEES
jgi:hypothetical protein